MNDFLRNETDIEPLQDLQHELFTFMLQKIAIAESSSEHPFINICSEWNMHRKRSSSDSI